MFADELHDIKNIDTLSKMSQTPRKHLASQSGQNHEPSPWISKTSTEICETPLGSPKPDQLNLMTYL